MAPGRRLAVREMELSEVNLRIDYFHGASDDDLRRMGVDRSLLPSRDRWREAYETDYALSVRQRAEYLLVWEVDDEIVGFSSADHIDFGNDASMHLHILDPGRRCHGLGAALVAESARTYFRVLELRQLFCEPNAFNVAPNRTLQRAGFRYVFTHETTPGPINFRQPTTRWVLDRPA